MAKFSWRRWLHSIVAQRPRKGRRGGRQLHFDALEDRVTPSGTFTWTGGGGPANTFWSDSANWTGPSGTPQTPTGSGDDLVFPSGLSGLSQNDLAAGAFFHSITFQGSSYTISGKDILLGTAAGGKVSAAQNTTGNVINANFQFTNNVEELFADTGASYTINGTLTNAGSVPSAQLTKDGAGTVFLGANNSGYAGGTSVTAGSLGLKNAGALGPTSNTTTVLAPGQVQVATAGLTIANPIILNGQGPNADGALLASAAGADTWNGALTLASDTFLGASAGATLTINGAISDFSTQNLDKVGAGQITFTTTNSYHGLTNIDNGILAISDPGALGASGNGSVNGTIVNSTAGGFVGTLELLGGITVQNEQLTLNGNGFNNLGALYNFSGSNTWTSNPLSNNEGNILLGSPANQTTSTNVVLNTNNGSTLTVSSLITDPNQVDTFNKIGLGTLILQGANTYRGTTTIQAGTVIVEDSKALGAVAAGTTVNNGAMLELMPNPNPAYLDSVTNDDLHLQPAEPLTINGNGLAGHGALYSNSGINTWNATVTLASSSSIGVDPPLPGTETASANYFTNDWSLTLNLLSNSSSPNIALTKVGTGQLIVPNTNAATFAGPTTISQGWITVESPSSLGGVVAAFGDTTQPDVITVTNGAALHLLPKTGQSINLPNNLVLTGDGLVHAFNLISQKGAVLSLEGTNTLSGILKFSGQAGIGVQEISGIAGFANASGILTLTGAMQDNGAVKGGIDKLGQYQLQVEGPGTYTGDVNIDEGVLTARNNTAFGSGVGTATVALPGPNTPGGAALELQSSVPITSGGNPVGTGLQILGETLVLNGTGLVGGGPAPFNDWAPLVVVDSDHLWRGPISLVNQSPNTDVRIQIDANARLTVTGIIDDNNSPTNSSGLTVFGGVGGGNNGVLALAGANTYRGITQVGSPVAFGTNSQNATVIVENSNALGAAGTAASGTVVLNGSSLEVQGSITIAGEQLQIEGNGTNDPSLTPTWFAQGPAPINKGFTPGNMPVTGRITGVSTDPSDPNTIFISAAGGGAWKTIDGGATWQALTNNSVTNLGANTEIDWSGAIAVAPSNPRTVYLGTGEANNVPDSYYGEGVFQSTDSGQTWHNLINTVTGSNPGAVNNAVGFSPFTTGKFAVSKIIVDPGNANIIYVAASDQATISNAGTAADPVGVWRWDGSSWFCLTDVVSVVRTSGVSPQSGPPPPPMTPGPDDDWRFTFPTSGADYTDLTLFGGTLYMALGTAGGGPNNAVYRCFNPNSLAPIWDIGDGATDSRTAAEFPAGNNGAAPDNGVTRIGAGFNLATLTTYVYAAVTSPINSGLLRFELSTDGGLTWAAVPGIPDYLNPQGEYDSALAVNPTFGVGTDVYVAGVGSGPNQGTNDIYHLDFSTNPVTVTDISTDSAGNGPHSDVHALRFDKNINGNVLAGTDGGIWRYDPVKQLWTDLNGNLQITEFNGLDVGPTDPNFAIGASQDNGAEVYSGTPAWTRTSGPDGGSVQINPKVPSIAYFVNNNGLQKSTDGGTTWAFTGLIGTTLYFPFAIDQVNPARLLAGDTTLGNIVESNNNGASFTALGAAPFAPVEVVPAQFDQNGIYDPNTIYAGGNGLVEVTHNRGTTWTTAAVPGRVSDLVVDPTNDQIAYAAFNTLGIQNVYKTTDGGKTWNKIQNNPTTKLPDSPVSALAFDPRNGTLYVGTDSGVYSSSDQGKNWAVFGIGLPTVQIHHLVLNQTLNTLSVATYGRGMFTVYLNDPIATPGALRSLSGVARWTGPITLTGSGTTTTISADGVQGVQSGISVAQLVLIGPIGDNGNNNALLKVGFGDVALNGANSYGGLTTVSQGQLIVNSFTALGLTSTGTVVNSGAALETLSSIVGEPLTLNGDGIPFNGHNTGALHNVGVNDTYAGPITLNTASVTIGVDTNTTLTLTGVISGPVADNLTKELLGTLVYAGVADPSYYSGQTLINQGTLQIQNAGAVANTAIVKETATSTQVQLQAAGGLAANAVDVPLTPLSLIGTGIFGAGALQTSTDPAATVTINNTWGGPITINQTLPAGPNLVAVGADMTPTSLGTLTISGVISEGTAGATLSKVGAGRVILTTDNLFTGPTDVTAGALQITSANALGTGTAGAVVSAGATLEVNATGGPFSTPATQPVTLTGDGVNYGPGNEGALDGFAGKPTWGGNVLLASNGPVTDAAIGAESGVSGASPFTIAGTIGDAVPTSPASLTKLGLGTVLLPVANSYVGQTFINNGLLLMEDPGALTAGPTTTATISNASWAANVATITTSANHNFLVGQRVVIAGTGGYNGTYTITSVGAPNTFTYTLVGNPGNPPSFGTATGRNAGATVNGGTLQLANGIAVPATGTTLTLIGNGFNPGTGSLGALEGTKTGSPTSTWGAPITLGANASVGAEAGATLVISGVIGDNGNGFGVTAIGPSVVQYAQTASNTYTGPTTVSNGTLQLNASVPMLNGPLVIGPYVGAGAGTATALWLKNNQVGPAVVTVNPTGILNLNGKTDSFDTLDLAGGTAPAATTASVTTGAGTLNVNALNINGGTITIGSGGQLRFIDVGPLLGTLTATTDASTSPGLITGAGTVTLNGNRTFTVNQNLVPFNPAAIDLKIDAVIAGAGNDLSKAGNGNLDLTQNNTYSGTTRAQAGTLSVDGSVGAASLEGGTLAGTGTIASITTAAAGGLVSPAGVGTIGTLSVAGTIAWTGNATLDLDLSHPSSSDLLTVGGDVNLNGAQLGARFPGVLVGDTFTVLTVTGGHHLLGSFGYPANGTFYLSGRQFNILYDDGSGTQTTDNANNAAVKVILKASQNTTQTTITPNYSGQATVGESLSYLIKVAPTSAQSAPIPDGDTVNVQVDGGAIVSLTLTGGQVIFNAGTLSISSHNPHAISATFNPTNSDPDFQTSSNSISVTVVAANTSISLSAPTPAAPIYDQTFSITATVSPLAPGGGTVTSGSVTFFIDGIQIGTPVGVNGSGQALLNVPAGNGLNVGSHSVHAVYGGSTDTPQSYLTSSTLPDSRISIGQAAATFAGGSGSRNPSVYGEQVVLSADLAQSGPGGGIPTGAVTFYDNLPISSATESGNTVTITTAVPHGYVSNQKVTISGVSVAGYNGPFTITVLGPTTFTYTDSSVGLAPGSGGTTTTVLGTATASTGSGGVASLTYTTPVLSVTGHNITATYAGDSNFTAIPVPAALFTQTVVKDNSSLAFTTSSSPLVNGQAFTLTATISAAIPSNAAIASISESGTLVTVNTTAPHGFSNNQVVTIVGVLPSGYDGSFAITVTSPTQFTFNAAAGLGTATLSGASANPDPLVSPAPIPTGTVTFYIDGKSQSPANVTLNASGQAQLSIPAGLAEGPHTIDAVYSGDSNFNAIALNTSPLALAIGPAATRTTLNTLAPVTYGQGLTLTATVIVTGAGTGNPTGNVNFVVDSTTYTGAVNTSTNTATVVVNGLTAGNHTIVANYQNSDGAYQNSNSSSVIERVLLADTRVDVTVNANNSTVFGQTASFVAQVTALAPGAGIPSATSTVSFFLDNATTPAATLNVDATTGQATYSTATLPTGKHTLTAKFNGDANFNPSAQSPAASLTVLPADSKTTLKTSAPTGASYGTAVTYTATVAGVSPGAGTPVDGELITFSFISRNTPQTFVFQQPLKSGTATLTLSTLPADTYNVTAFFPADGSFNTSTSAVVPQTITQVASGVGLVSSDAAAVYQEPLTFTATVGNAGPGTAVPTGFVQFIVNNTAQPNVLLDSNGQAQLPFATLPVSTTNSIVAKYLGDRNYAPASQSLTQSVGAASTSVKLSTSAGSITYGQSVTFTAQVSAGAPSAGIPTGGMVTFTAGSVTFSTAPDATGKATWTTTAVPAGVGNVTAQYTKDPNYVDSPVASVGEQVTPSPDAIGLNIATTGPFVVGETLSFVVTVSAAAPGGGTPDGGTVGIQIGNGTPTTMQLKAGTATVPVVAPSVGSYPITITYTGDPNYLDNTLNVAQPLVIGQSPSMTTLTPLSATTYGQPLTFFATVGAASPGGGTPGGNVAFIIDGTSHTVALSGGSASFTPAPPLSAGGHSIIVSYAGDPNYLSSDSGPAQMQAINPASTTTTLAPLSTITYGQPLTFSASVAAVAPGSGTPTGNIVFTIDGTGFSAPVSNTGTATFTPATPLTAGTHSVSATYAGDGNFRISSDVPRTQTINKDNSSIGVTSSLNPSGFGAAVTFTATITPAAPGGLAPGGNAVFTVDSSTFTQPLTGGVATLQLSNLDVGSHNVSVSYAGDGNYNAPAGPVSLTQTVNQTVTTMSLSSSDAANAVIGEVVTFTAVINPVAPGGGAPDGSVAFSVDGGSATIQPLDATGTATLQISTLSLGGHTIQASYAGNTHYTAISQSVAQQISAASTGTTVTANPAAPVYGQNVTLMATVTPTPPGGGQPAGSVTFLVDGHPTTVALDPSTGTATLNAGVLSLGNHTISAGYGGNGNYNASTGALNLAVKQASTTSAVSANVNPSVFGQPVTYTVVVSPVSGSVAPTGTVNFIVDGDAAHPLPQPLDASGKATLVLASLPAGAHTITATYTGDPNFQPSSTTAGVNQTVTKATGTLAVSSSPTTPVAGQGTTITATVSAAAPGGGVATGNVTFLVDGKTFTKPLDNAGNAQLTLSLSAGSHSVSASYPGDSNFTAPPTAVLTESVNQASSSIALTSSAPAATPPVFGQPVTFTATVAAVAPGSGTPTGNVIFTVDNKQFSAPVDQTGVAKLTLSTLTVGSHGVTASYAGDGNFKASSAPASLIQAVNPAAVNVNLTSASSPGTFGAPLTFTVTVSPVAPGAGTPTGTASFAIDGTAQTPVNLDGNGQATFTTSSLARGNHQVSVQYTPAAPAQFLPGSAALTQPISNAATTTTVTTSSTPSVFGQLVVFTATVASAPTGLGTPGGALIFTVDGTDQPQMNLDANGQATLSLTTLGVSQHTVTARYLGDPAQFLASSAGGLLQVINPAAATIALAPTASSVAFGQGLQITANVSAVAPGAGTPTGAVTVTVDGTAQSPATLVNGQVTIPISGLSRGTHVIAASYGGDSNFQTATGSLTLLVSNAATVTALSAPGPSLFSVPVSFTAFVVPALSGQGTATGNITFSIDGTAAQSLSLVNGGQATVTFNNLSAGSHQITATYFGDSNFQGSSVTVTQQVNPAATVVNLTGPTAPTAGQPVTVTATVGPVAPATGVPTGKITFTVDGTARPAVDLSGGQASLNLGALSVGTHTITAAYSGSANFQAPATATSLTEKVGQASTSISVGSSLSVAAVGQAVTFTATVLGSVPGASAPTGSVNFSVDGGPATPAPLNAGQATLTLSNLSLGNHTVTASYAGDPNFQAAPAPATLTQQIGQLSNVALTTSSSPTAFGQLLVLTATVTGTGGTPTGSVIFSIDGTAQAPVNLASGTATLSPALSAGTHTVTAQYSGDNTFQGATASPLSQQINPAGTTVSVTSSASPVTFGTGVTLTATVAVVAPGTGTPTGSVIFGIDGTNQSPVALTGGSATLSVPNLAGGNHQITAQYVPDANFQASSGSFTQEVDAAPATVNLAPPVINGQTATLTATVSVPAGAGTPTGVVTFMVDGQAVGSAPLVNGSASFVAQALTAGPHSFSAVFKGSSNVAGSTSSSQSQVVPAASTTTGTSSTPTTTTTTPGTGTHGSTATTSLQIKVLSSKAGGPQTVTLQITPLDAHGHVVKTAKGPVTVRVLKGPHRGKVTLVKSNVTFKKGHATVVLHATKPGHYTVRLSVGSYAGQISVNFAH